MNQPGTNRSSVGDDIVLSPEHREAVHKNGTIEAHNRRVAIDKDLVRVELKIAAADLPSVIYECRILEEVLRLHKRVFVLALEFFGRPPMPADCRRWIAEWGRKNPVNAIAWVNNGNSVSNAIYTLLVRAINLLQRQPMKFAFFQEEAQARAWLDELRQNPG